MADGTALGSFGTLQYSMHERRIEYYKYNTVELKKWKPFLKKKWYFLSFFQTWLTRGVSIDNYILNNKLNPVLKGYAYKRTTSAL